MRVPLRLAIATLTTIVSLLLLAAPLVAHVQPAAPPSGRLWRVGILFQADTTGRGGRYLEAIRQGFRDLGYVEGRDLTIEQRSAAGDLARLGPLAHELVRLPVDVIMTVDPGIDAAMAAITTIPIVMLSSSDPVERRQVQSVARPGGNVTGMTVTFDRGHRLAKQLQLLKEASPKVSRVGILARSSPLRRPGEPDPHEAVLVAARQLALTVFFVPFDAAAQLDTALATVTRERADALFVDGSGPNILRRHEVAEFALRHRLPSVAGMREMAEAGGSDTPWNRSSSAAPPVFLPHFVQDQAKRHPDPRGDESQAPAFELGRARVIPRPRPINAFDRTARSPALARAGQPERWASPADTAHAAATVRRGLSEAVSRHPARV